MGISGELTTEIETILNTYVRDSEDCKTDLIRLLGTEESVSGKVNWNRKSTYLIQIIYQLDLYGKQESGEMALCGFLKKISEHYGEDVKEKINKLVKKIIKEQEEQAILKLKDILQPLEKQYFKQIQQSYSVSINSPDRLFNNIEDIFKKIKNIHEEEASLQSIVEFVAILLNSHKFPSNINGQLTDWGRNNTDNFDQICEQINQDIITKLEANQSLENNESDSAVKQLIDWGLNFSLGFDKKGFIYEQLTDIKNKINSLQDSDNNTSNKVDKILEIKIQIDNLINISQISYELKTQELCIFKCDRIYKEYERFNLKEFSINLNLGEITAVTGENGAGKTTLLRIIAGELATTRRENAPVTYPAIMSGEPDFTVIKEKIAYIPQELQEWSGSLVNNLYLTASIHGEKGKDNKKHVDLIITRWGLSKYKEAQWSELSSGYKLRFSLAKALISNPKLIILDEPLANLDIKTQLEFLKDLQSLASPNRNPTSILISSHHIYEIENIADKILFIEDGIVKDVTVTADRDIEYRPEKNSYELTFDKSFYLSNEKLGDFESEMNCERVDKFEQTWIIDINLTSKKLLQTLIDKDILITYFRDITNSSRNLFRRNRK